ncbi:hypothetical protein L1987_81121 [Smallanthus sonchifolius]|uniref:Uncharacterized protein n=1 Tax=Smallanthus sonchifolius TaxID=185202 RepID=A0ACB8YPK5_9ASTR|nr:hypothetical protein L1987_81121 [Smallanthus sonchifolius]
MELFYLIVFGGLAVVVATMELSKNNKDRINTSSAFNSFKNNYLFRGFEQQWLSITFSKAIFLGNGLVAILAGLFGNLLVGTLALGPVAPFDAASIFLAIGMAVILSSWTENYCDPSESKDLMTQFRGAAVAIASDEKIALLGSIQSHFEGSMYTFVFLWTPALSPNGEDIPHGFIFATFMLSSMLGSSLASRLLARAIVKVESYMQIVFIISSASLLLPVITSVDAFPIVVMFGMCSAFLFIASMLQRRLLGVAERSITVFDHQWRKRWLVRGYTVVVTVEIMLPFMMISFLKLFRGEMVEPFCSLMQ